jgi:hypothetical protein
MSNTQTAAKATSAKVRTPKTRTFDVGRAGAKVFKKLRTARQVKLAAEREFKPLDTAAKQLFADEGAQLKLKDSLILVGDGETIGRVTREPGAKAVDLDLLLSAFPEAYEKCVSDTNHLRFYPA